MHGLQPLKAVRAVLSSYARRGVFRSFQETFAGPGKVCFQFHWLWNAPFTLTFHPKSGALSFDGLLPEVARGSELEKGLKAFIAECCSPGRVEHRRVDPRRVSVAASNRGGRMSVRVRARNNDYDYAARKAVQLANEILLSYISVHYPDYLVKHFRAPEE